ncbi:hypothetical protein RhiirA5_444913 [Rhizophagus irregularis]|uniref:Uncharacterized protein n=1 Tax=Rhizophagus irregularis TaxID=588596 RepID=A0A2N0NCS1_9GLOM|nr:hypothetical protein RhiirA5_444913 [Rhizophagus irregularis]
MFKLDYTDILRCIQDVSTRWNSSYYAWDQKKVFFLVFSVTAEIVSGDYFSHIKHTSGTFKWKNFATPYSDDVYQEGSFRNKLQEMN